MLDIPDDTEAFWELFREELDAPEPPIPLEETPIYAQMRAEEFAHIQDRINLTFQHVEDAIRQLGQGARAAFVSFDELDGVARAALKAGRTRPADQYTITRKPLLKNRKRR